MPFQLFSTGLRRRLPDETPRSVPRNGPHAVAGGAEGKQVGTALALVISSLTRGGAERVLSLLANQWAARGRRITLITLAAIGADEYRLHPAIQRVGLDVRSESRGPFEALASNARRWRRLRAALRRARPDMVISFMAETNLLTLASCLGLGVPVVVSERVDPRMYSIGRLRSSLRRWLYPRARAVVVQTERAGEWMRRRVPGARVHVVPNPALAPESGDGAPAGREGRWIVAMGRLTRQKGFDLLLRAFARCASGHRGWSLVILGEGEERARLSALRDSLGLAGTVELPGQVENPTEWLRRADLFVLPSRFEGFPNALLEAMALGLAAIAADCPSGPAEIVEHGRSGLLVPPEDVDALAAAMHRLMGDEEERRRLGSRAVEITRRYDPGRVTDLWERVIAEALSARPGSPSGRALKSGAPGPAGGPAS